MLTEMPTPVIKRIKVILDIMNYLEKFLPSTAEVCEPLRKLTSSKCFWTWNDTYQCPYDGTKTIIKKNATMAFYNEKEQLYLETDVSGVGLGAGLLQVRDDMQFSRNEVPDNAVLWPVAFMTKGITSTKTCYSNIEKEILALSISIA